MFNTRSRDLWLKIWGKKQHWKQKNDFRNFSGFKYKFDRQSVGLYRDILPQTFLHPNIPVSKYSCIQIFLYPTTAEDNTQQFEPIHATKFPFELFLCLTTACSSECAPFLDVNCPSKAWSVFFPAQPEASNLFCSNLLVAELIFSSGEWVNLFKNIF